MHETVTVNGVSRTWELRHRITGDKLTEGALMTTRKGRPVKLCGASLPCSTHPDGQVTVEYITSSHGAFAGKIVRYNPYQVGAVWVECSPPPPASVDPHAAAVEGAVRADGWKVQQHGTTSDGHAIELRYRRFTAGRVITDSWKIYRDGVQVDYAVTAGDAEINFLRAKSGYVRDPGTGTYKRTD